MEKNIIEQIKKERLDVEDLKKMYGLKSERTLSVWKKTKGFPMIEITPQQKYAYLEDLIKWERSFLQSTNNLVNFTISRKIAHSFNEKTKT